MLLHAHSHKFGAKKLARKYNLPYKAPKQYISEKDLKKHGIIFHRDKLFHALQDHKVVHAYVLPNLHVYFHPDTIMPVIGEEFKKYFSSLV